MNVFEYLKLSISLKPYTKRYQKNLQFAQKIALQNALIKMNNQRKKVLICMHSFEWGGAERFAYETIKFLRENGIDFSIFVEKRTKVADYFLEVIDGVSVVYAEYYQKSENQLFNLILERGSNIVYIHHSWSAYRVLESLPRNIFVIDSLHIVEYQTGGYPYLSAKNSCYIDIHHVVSYGLQSYLVNELGVAPHKIEVAFLLRNDYIKKHEKNKNSDKFVVGFLGRFEKQKRPELFIELARILTKNNNSLCFLMQGDGSLRQKICEMIDRYNLKNIEMLVASDDIEYFYQKIDVLVNCSENEGLALVGIESLQYNTLFASTHVGQQNEIVASECLIGPNPIHFIRQGVELIERLMRDNEFKQMLLAKQERRLQSLINASFRERVLEKYL